MRIFSRNRQFPRHPGTHPIQLETRCQRRNRLEHAHYFVWRAPMRYVSLSSRCSGANSDSTLLRSRLGISDLYGHSLKEPPEISSYLANQRKGGLARGPLFFFRLRSPTVGNRESDSSILRCVDHEVAGLARTPCLSDAAGPECSARRSRWPAGG